MPSAALEAYWGGETGELGELGEPAGESIFTTTAQLFPPLYTPVPKNWGASI